MESNNNQKVYLEEHTTSQIDLVSYNTTRGRKA